MSTPLSAGEIRAAAEVHRELGPDYSDAVVDSFLEKVDKEIEARIDARLPRTRTRPLPDKAQPDARRSLLIGIGVGGAIVGVLFTLLGEKAASINVLPADDFVAWAVILVAYLGFCVAVLARRNNDRD